MEIIIVGTGPGRVAWLTREAEAILLEAERVFFRMRVDPVCQWLEKQGKEVVLLDFLYSVPGMTYERLYKIMALTLLKEAKSTGRVVCALAGNPCVFELVPELLRSDPNRDIELKIVLGMSFLDLIYRELSIDPARGVQIIEAGTLQKMEGKYSIHLGMIVGQVGHLNNPNPSSEQSNVESIMKTLLERYPENHEVFLVWTNDDVDFEARSQSLLLNTLVESFTTDMVFASLYLPPVLPPNN